MNKSNKFNFIFGLEKDICRELLTIVDSDEMKIKPWTKTVEANYGILKKENE